MKRWFLLIILAGIVIGNQSLNADSRNVSDQNTFSIVPNAKEDQTKKIQAYIDKVAENGGTVYLAAGHYSVHGSITIPTGVTLVGSWEIPHHGILAKGTVIEAFAGRGTEAGSALIELQESSGIKGLTIVYPEQKLIDVQPYPWTIHGIGMHNTVENVTLVNSYQGICIGPESNELHLIRNVFGCVLRRGIFIDNCTDIGRIENVHFNPHYWPRSGHAGAAKGVNDPTMTAAKYMQEHLEAFIFARTDWQYVTNTFIFGAKVGYRFIKSAKGKCNGQLSGIGADMCGTCVLIDDVPAYGLSITNGQFVGSAGIVTSPSFKGVVQATNCTFWGGNPDAIAIKIEGDGTVSLSQMSTAAMKCALDVDVCGGRAIISNCVFHERKINIRVKEEVKKAIVTGNLAYNGLQIENHAGTRLIASNNE